MNGSGICGFMPGTHFQSSDSGFHRCTCASTMIRLDGWALVACEAIATPVAITEVPNCRRDIIPNILPIKRFMLNELCSCAAMTVKP